MYKTLGLWYWIKWSFLFTILFIGYEIFSAATCGDPSAMAIFGFLPFLLPLFWLYALMPTVVLAVVVEIYRFLNFKK